MKHKNRLYTDVIYLLTTFKQINIYQHTESLNPAQVKETLLVLAQYQKGIITEEMLKEITETLIPGAESIFTREISLVKLKEYFKTINNRIIIEVKAKIIQFNGLFQDSKSKRSLIEQMLQMNQDQLETCNQTKTRFNTDFNTKELFLISCKEVLVKYYRGSLFLNNSAIELVKVLERLLNSVFDPEGPNKGKEVIQRHQITNVLSKIKNYIDREEIQKTNLDDFITFNQDEIEQERKAFQVLPGKSIDYIINFIKRAHQPDPNAKPDDKQANAIAWSTLIFKLNEVTSTAEEHFKNNIQPKLQEISCFPIDDLEIIVEKIDELYKIEDSTGDMDRYIKLLSQSMISYDLYLELMVYDLYSYITSLEYINFILKLVFVVCNKFNDDKDKQNKESEEKHNRQVDGKVETTEGEKEPQEEPKVENVENKEVEEKQEEKKEEEKSKEQETPEEPKQEEGKKEEESQEQPEEGKEQEK